MLLSFPTADDRGLFLSRLRRDEPGLAEYIKESFSQPTVVVVRSGDDAVLDRVRRAARRLAQVYEDVQFETMI